METKVEITFTLNGIKKDESGVISTLNVDMETKITDNETVDKAELIEFIKGREADGVKVNIQTVSGTKVVIVDEEGEDSYLRTLGDSNLGNDLTDLPEIEE